VPLDETAIRQLRDSATALDLYTWLAYRLPRIGKGRPALLSWNQLAVHFGPQHCEHRPADHVGNDGDPLRREPLGLHAAFDFPLLTLQQNPDLDSTTRLLLGSTSIFIGFSSIAFAMRLVRRVGRHHAPRTEIARERLAQLRRMWALLVVGSGAGFVGLIFVLTSIHHWLVNPERNVSLIVPVGMVSITIGIALLVVTSATYIIGRNRMRSVSQGFSSAPSRG